MSGYAIGSVSFTKTVKTNDKFIISVAVIDWDYIKKSVSTWGTLTSKYKKWSDLVG